MIGRTGCAPLDVEDRVCGVGIDGLIDLLDGAVVGTFEFEARCSQDKRVAFLAFGRWLANFPERRGRWNAAGRECLARRRLLRSGDSSNLTCDDQRYRDSE